MPDDPVIDQIESLGYRRLAGCAVKALILIAASVLLARRIEDRHLRACAAFAVCGLVFGFAASIMAAGARKLLGIVFVILPLVASLCMFACRTLFGYEKLIPLRLALAPLALAAAFLAAQFRRPPAR